MADLIITEGLSKRFGSTIALSDVGLRVPEGKVFALLGENGAGKTTLIRILTGFQKPDSGSATILGHDCHRQSLAIRRQIGYVSDSPPLYEWMDASQIGWFTSGFYSHVDSFAYRYHQLIASFSVPLGTKIGKMSKGQRSKVALALATAHDPDLLILDEPTSGLDPIVRRQFLESMVERAADGRTVFLSSHHINEVERVADIIAILHQGQLKVIEPLDELKHRTRIVTVTLDRDEIDCTKPRGNVLSETISGRQRRWVVASMPDDWASEYAANRHVLHFDQKVPTLEEIFVAVCDHPIAQRNSETAEVAP